MDKEKTLWRKNSVDRLNKKVFGHNEQWCVWRREGEAFNPKNTKPAVKLGGGSAMLWCYFAASGSGCSKESKWNNDEGGLSPNSPGKPTIISRRLALGWIWVFWRGNDPKHTSEIVKKWLNQVRREVFRVVVPSPDLNYMKNMWTVLKKQVHARKTTHLIKGRILWKTHFLWSLPI